MKEPLTQTPMWTTDNRPVSGDSAVREYFNSGCPLERYRAAVAEVGMQIAVSSIRQGGLSGTNDEQFAEQIVHIAKQIVSEIESIDFAEE